MAPRPTTKRSQSSEGTSAHAAKKTRFVEPDDDPANFAESVDSQLEDGARRGRRFVTEGYDSDSTDDGEGVVLSRRAGDAEDEDEDMFAVGAKEESAAKSDGASAKKKEEFLRLGDIEGQEFGGGEESASEDDEPEDLDDAERRKKAGMGFELSSFNMREEMEEGKFSADGTYIRSFDPHAVHDKWMEEFDEKDIKKARRLHRHQERIQKEKQKAEEREMQQLGEKEDMEKALLPLLKKGETVLEALQRLGAKAKKATAQKKRFVVTSCFHGLNLFALQAKQQDETRSYGCRPPSRRFLLQETSRAFRDRPHNPPRLNTHGTRRHRHLLQNVRTNCPRGPRSREGRRCLGAPFGGHQVRVQMGRPRRVRTRRAGIRPVQRRGDARVVRGVVLRRRRGESQGQANGRGLGQLERNRHITVSDSINLAALPAQPKGLLGYVES